MRITTTHDADAPLVHGEAALITCDLWEQPYSLDHQNRRPAFLETWVGHLANWGFAETNLAQARAAADAA